MARKSQLAGPAVNGRKRLKGKGYVGCAVISSMSSSGHRRPQPLESKPPDDRTDRPGALANYSAAAHRKKKTPALSRLGAGVSPRSMVVADGHRARVTHGSERGC